MGSLLFAGYHGSYPWVPCELCHILPMGCDAKVLRFESIGGTVGLSSGHPLSGGQKVLDFIPCFFFGGGALGAEGYGKMYVVLPDLPPLEGQRSTKWRILDSPLSSVRFWTIQFLGVHEKFAMLQLTLIAKQALGPGL